MPFTPSNGVQVTPSGVQARALTHEQYDRMYGNPTGRFGGPAPASNGAQGININRSNRVGPSQDRPTPEVYSRPGRRRPRRFGSPFSATTFNQTLSPLEDSGPIRDLLNEQRGRIADYDKHKAGAVGRLEHRLAGVEGDVQQRIARAGVDPDSLAAIQIGTGTQTQALSDSFQDEAGFQFDVDRAQTQDTEGLLSSEMGNRGQIWDSQRDSFQSALDAARFNQQGALDAAEFNYQTYYDYEQMLQQQYEDDLRLYQAQFA
jgi:hypothetical protein